MRRERSGSYRMSHARLQNQTLRTVGLYIYMRVIYQVCWLSPTGVVVTLPCRCRILRVLFVLSC